jgi:glucokinase
MKRLGIDLGGTHLKFGVVHGGNASGKGSCPTPLMEGYDAVVRRIAEMAYPLLQENPEIQQVGIGSPGLIDAEAGLVCCSNNFGWVNKPLLKDLQKALGLEVRIANDAHCAALGEALHGAGQNCARVAMLTIGTGIGGGFVKDGILDTSRYGSMAYILGHAIIQRDGMQCNCGRKGCLEAYASAGSMAKKAKPCLGQGASARMVFEAAKEGDSAALAIVDEFVECLAEGAVDVANVLRPHVIVIGGGVSDSSDLFLPAINKRLEENVYGYAYAPVHAVKAALGNDAGVVGAACLWK